MRKLTEKEKKILAEHNKLTKHTKAQKLKMIRTISSSSTKYETKNKMIELHKKLFGK